MPSTTSHYGFEQPYGNEQLAPTNFNDNWGKLDTMFYQMSQRVSTLERIAIPIGGTQGQPLLKASSNDNDVTWGTLDVHHGGTGAIDATTARANLDAARTKHEHPASDITSGALALARGGTGIDNSVNIPSKTFFAAPTNNSGAASFRLIVEADLPNISAAKITSGVLALARGGTGVDNSTGRTAKTFFAAPTANAGSASFRTIDEADLPNLNASKITRGTFAVDRIPNISIAKGGTGKTTAADARVALGANNAANLTTGTLPDARISDGKWIKLNSVIAYRVRGGFCTVQGYSPSAAGSQSLTKDTYTLVGTLPAAARPTCSSILSGKPAIKGAGTTMSNNCLIVEVYANGDIRCWIPNGGKYWHFLVTFPVG